jgi:hypothetical protein
MNLVPRQVIVEYVFDNVAASLLPNLPERVQAAITHLVAAEELVSDAAVRSRVFAFGGNDGALTARVRILVPEPAALDLALHRSFEEGGNAVRTQAVTADELHRLMTRSAAIRVRQLRAANHIVARRRAARRVAERANPRIASTSPSRRRRSSPVRPTCAICLDTVRYSTQRLYLDCTHVFHRGCIVEWLQHLPRKCPTCREPVNLSPRPGDVEHPRTRAQTRGVDPSSPQHTSEGLEICL